jgi:hypothetical protein
MGSGNIAPQIASIHVGERKLLVAAKRLMLKNLVFSLVTITATNAFAERMWIVVPFSFTAKTHVFPAGKYEVTMDPTESFITLAGETDAANNISVLVGPADRAHAETVLTFGVVGRNHCLKTLQMGPRVSSQLSTCDRPNSDAQYSVGAQ